MNNIELYENGKIGEKYYKCLHNSGLTIYVFQKETSTFYASLTVRFGSLYNDVKFSDSGDFETLPLGVAHFLEHKLFEKEGGGDAFEDFAVFGGDANAYTTKEFTSYLVSGTENFSENLSVLLGFVYNPFFSQKSVEKEKSIIAQEIKMYEDSPFNKVYYNMLSAMYHNHPVKENICGSVSSVSKITPQMLYRCYNAFYVPKNMFLTVCGNVNLDEIIEICDRYVPERSWNSPVVRFDVEPKNIVSSSCTEKTDVSIANIAFAFKGSGIFPNAMEREKYSVAIDMIGDLMFGVSSNFYYDLYDRNLVVGAIMTEHEYGKNYDFSVISVTTQNVEQAKQAIIEYIEKMPKAVPDTGDFQRIKNMKIAEYLKEFDSSEYIAENIVSATSAGIDLFKIFDIIEEIDYDYIMQVMIKAFKIENMVVSTIVPKGEKNAKNN